MLPLLCNGLKLWDPRWRVESIISCVVLATALAFGRGMDLRFQGIGGHFSLLPTVVFLYVIIPLIMVFLVFFRLASIFYL